MSAAPPPVPPPVPPPAGKSPPPAPPPQPEQAEPDFRSPFERIKEWLISIGSQSWLASLAIHMLIIIIFGLVAGTVQVAATIGSAAVFELAVPEDEALPEVTHFEVGNTPIEPTELTTETLSLTEAPSVEAQFNDNSPLFEEAGGGIASATDAASFGGLGGFDVSGPSIGAMVKGPGGVGGAEGISDKFGKGGAGEGFGSRGSGMRQAMVGSGGTKQSERAVAAALNWFARHQNASGSWSINQTKGCSNGVCRGGGDHESDPAASARALLPYFAAGQTHLSNGPYQKNIGRGISWLMRNQKQNGDLSGGAPGSQMYTHGLATLALCEAYGMTQESRIGYAAQAAINFIETGQNREGSWRYTHGSPDSDTSVFGWQVMALKSGQMARLKVNPQALDSARRYLRLCATGQYGSEFSYMPSGGGTYTMTSVGLLTSQYLGAKRDDPVVVHGVEYLMKRKPSLDMRNTYYWYYATQVMHNVPGQQWDEWNREMRKILINTQEKTGCAAGSWDPNQPEPDPWANQGGRLMVTSLSTLTLEVYYRYLPLYKLDKPEEFELE